MRHLFLLLAVVSSFCTTLQARNVKGTVTSEKKSLSGVIVTDGTNLTTTSKNGSFEMNISDNAEFVYIVTPSGYAADWSTGVPQFYQKAAGKNTFDFDLKKLPTSKSTYNILAVGDPQPRKEEHFDEFAKIPLDDLTQMGASLEGQVVGIALGDICFDVFPLMDRWKEEIPRAGFPFYTAVGNHDHDKQYKDDTAAIGGYRERFGPENHAFMIGNDLVILLDNIIYHSQSGYELGYTEDIINWVNGLMKYIPKKADIYIAQHSSTNGRHYKGGMIKRYDALVDAPNGHKITFLSGHNHTTGNFEYAPGITEHNIAAICGTWWDVYHCTDGTPRGYKVFTKEGKDLKWYYKAIGKDRNYQYEIYRPGQTKLHPECVVVNIWDYDAKWNVVWKEDGKDMGAMEQVEEYSPIHEADMKALYSKTGKKIPSYRQTKCAKHYFAAKPSSGAKKITIEITDRFGNCWSETIEL
jgi:hypothetical protein